MKKKLLTMVVTALCFAQLTASQASGKSLLSTRRLRLKKG